MKKPERAAGRPHPLLSVTDVFELPPPAWVLADFLPRGGLVALIGQKASFKSFLALDWALHIAYGLPWYGHEVHAGPVLYIAAEGKSGLNLRLRAWFHHFRQDPKQDVFRVLPDSLNFSDPDEIGNIKATINKWETPVLVVVDTLARSMMGDENSVEDMRRVILTAEQIQRDYNATVLFLHHTPKNGTTARGSGSFPGALDAEFLLERKKLYAYATLACSKMKDASEPPDYCITTSPVTGQDCDKVSGWKSQVVDSQGSLVIGEAAYSEKKWDRDPDGKRKAVSRYVSKNKKASVREVAQAVGVSRATAHRIMRNTNE